MEEFRKGSSPLPWFMFTDANCSKSGIDVHPAGQYDPGWSVSSVSHGDAELFFRKSNLTNQFLAEIKSESLAVHWHNQWDVEPEHGSPFQVLLEEESLELKLDLEKIHRLGDRS
jgi:hypothetical protein